MASNTARTGAAGTFHAAAQLADRGWDASLTIGNTPRTDLVAQHSQHQTLIAVQCKTTTGTQTFLLGKSCESPSLPGRNEWFILIALRGTDVRPEFFIVPRNVAAAYVFVGHRAWLTVPGKNGKPHQPNTMRDVEQRAMNYYRERWDLLELPADSVPCWLPDWVFEWTEHVGLPDGHPGIVKPVDGVMSSEDAAWSASWVPPRPGKLVASAGRDG